MPDDPLAGLTLHQAERELIERTINAHPVPIAAKMLGIGKSTLYRKVADHGLALEGKFSKSRM